MQRARLVLRFPRESRRRAVVQTAGDQYSEEGPTEKVPVNLLSMYKGVVGRTLIAQNPRVMLSTFDRAHKATVASAQSWINQEIERVRMARTLGRIVTDSLYSIGIAKVALGSPADSARFAWHLPAGAVFLERVDLDDFVLDIHARDFGEVGFIGHRYRAPLDAIKDSKFYSKARKELTPSWDQLYNLEGDERVSVLGRTTLGGDGLEFEDYVDLWEVYIPRHRLVLTLADEQLTGASSNPEPLRVQNWIGPDEGPYHMLTMDVVPGNLMPKGPMMDLIGLHLFANQTYRKLMNQTQRQKEVTLVQGGASEDGNRIMDADDGTMPRVDNPDGARVVNFGGPNQALLAMFQQTYDIFNRQAGNLELMGGLGPQSKTATQDKMLNANASGQVAEMQETTITFVADVVKAMLWYWWKDPYKVMRTTHSVPGLPHLSAQRQITPQLRQEVRFEDLDIRIDPYSLKHKSPEQRLADLTTTVTQIVLPMMQLAQQQGITLDLNTYLSKVGQYQDDPDLAEILTIMEPSQAQGEGGTDGPRMPTSTTRTYDRRSSGTGTRNGQDISRLNAMKTMANGQANGSVQ